MIYSFDQIIEDDWFIDKEKREKVEKGLEIFAKYIHALWSSERVCFWLK
jgi:hypothetical protein